MPPKVTLTSRAQADIQEITDYLLHDLDLEPGIVAQRLATILSKFRYLAEHELLNREVAGLEGTGVLWWLTNGKKYIIYFRRTGPQAIKVLRVRDARQQLLEPDEIL